MNAQEIYRQITNDGIEGNAPVTSNRLRWNNPFHNNPFDELNQNSNAIDLAQANAKMLLEQNKFKYYHDEAIANTQIQRRVADLLKSGLNPYIANGLFGANGFAGDIPQSAAQAASGENKQKLDWKSFMAQSGMNMFQQIMSGVMSGFSIYQTQKAIMKAKEDSKNKKSGDSNNNEKMDIGKNIKENLENGARGLRDGLLEMEKFIPNIIAAIFGAPNWNF